MRWFSQRETRALAPLLPSKNAVRSHVFPSSGWYIESLQTHVCIACTRNHTVIYRVCTSVCTGTPAHTCKLLTLVTLRGNAAALTLPLQHLYLRRSCRDLLLDIEKVAFAAGNRVYVYNRLPMRRVDSSRGNNRPPRSMQSAMCNLRGLHLRRGLDHAQVTYLG